MSTPPPRATRLQRCPLLEREDVFRFDTFGNETSWTDTVHGREAARARRDKDLVEHLKSI